MIVSRVSIFSWTVLHIVYLLYVSALNYIYPNVSCAEKSVLLSYGSLLCCAVECSCL